MIEISDELAYLGSSLERTHWCHAEPQLRTPHRRVRCVFVAVLAPDIEKSTHKNGGALFRDFPTYTASPAQFTMNIFSSPNPKRHPLLCRVSTATNGLVAGTTRCVAFIFGLSTRGWYLGTRTDP